MKKIVLTLVAAMALSGAYAQEGNIKLNAPNMKSGSNIMEAFAKRQSTREFSDKALCNNCLSNLLWSANGINREDVSKRTAPTAKNQQEIDVYVCMEKGAYLYDAKAHELVLVTTEDLRPLVAGAQDFVKTAPVCLVIVADLERFSGSDTESGKMMIACDAGIVSQNISLFCAGRGFATVPRAWMEREKLAEALGLGATKLPILNHPVGYFKE